MSRALSVAFSKYEFRDIPTAALPLQDGMLIPDHKFDTL